MSEETTAQPTFMDKMMDVVMKIAAPLGRFVGLGVYLPLYLSLSAPIGAAAKFVYDRLAGRGRRDGELSHDDAGIVVASGLLGGESIVGVVIALAAVVSGLVG